MCACQDPAQDFSIAAGVTSSQPKALAQQPEGAAQQQVKSSVIDCSICCHLQVCMPPFFLVPCMAAYYYVVNITSSGLHVKLNSNTTVSAGSCNQKRCSERQDPTDCAQGQVQGKGQLLQSKAKHQGKGSRRHLCKFQASSQSHPSCGECSILEQYGCQ